MLVGNCCLVNTLRLSELGLCLQLFAIRWTHQTGKTFNRMDATARLQFCANLYERVLKYSRVL